ncbi:zinc-binding protein A33-like [Oncorhynchus masou masou]|uniref:zinc-binding protein A33-like n=1 Tax=Oncorhynchus masou masou TaxID=90313 RepID=UPI003183B482
MATTSSLPEEDLTCPVCRDIFRDPVILLCSHSFCKDCIHGYWREREVKECPVCRKRSKLSDAPLNRALKNLCEAYSKEKASASVLCSLHGEKYKLFCRDHGQPACLVCQTSELHTNHKFCPMDEAAKEYKESVLKLLQNKLEVLEADSRTCVQTADTITSQALSTERKIREQFEELHQFLRNETVVRIAALKQDQDNKSQMMMRKIEEMNREISSLSDTIQTLEEELGAENISLLQDYEVIKKRVQCILPDPERVSGALIDVARHLGNLQFRVWENMQEIVEYTPVILDPNTAHPDLILSGDLTSFTCRLSDDQQQIPDNPERFKHRYAVLGSEGFSSGTHSWDVEVGDSKEWAVGVAIESCDRKETSRWHISGVWYVLSREGSDYIDQVSPNACYCLEPFKVQPQRIRVQLDWDKETVSLSDPVNNQRIGCFFKNPQIFSLSFTERIFPFLSGDYVRVMPVKASVTV